MAVPWAYRVSIIVLEWNKKIGSNVLHAASWDLTHGGLPAGGCWWVSSDLRTLRPEVEER